MPHNLVIVSILRSGCLEGKVVSPSRNKSIRKGDFYALDDYFVFGSIRSLGKNASITHSCSLSLRRTVNLLPNRVLLFVLPRVL